ncbi:uncharacterized protein AC631_00038 [Debaryomyces fabryi]|uniref:Uncharacterized protein n=1 Tax=Debaryomyces fabryi TaxID=58627 RepID=A0A0V1Q6T5_9ASCO|nr:uncharacterized protein AC631_00038 [Debaryomyces fabryi]KSA04167.1 hypothetical protein AC631_00038 [Debaryomyces fabryi]CUM46223.1 unnamed protein product [Debaryomyces fabryi]
MEIDDPEYPNIDIDSITGQENNDASKTYIKQTLLHSPIITNIIPDFHVHISKRFRGLPSVTVNDEGEQYLCPQEEDSQFDVFSDDDDLLFNIGEAPPTGTAKSSSVGPNINIKLKSIRVIVKTTSMLINDVEFSFSAPIRSSCILRGVMDGKNQEEDSLMISLKSGFLFLIRIYYVPRHYKDTDYDIQGQIQSNESCIYKPFIVQWWDTSSDLSVPALESSGYSLNSHASGLSAVSTSASSVFRIYNCQHTDSGIMFMPHFNVPVDGIILHSCFAEPLNNSVINNHIMFLIMSFTESRRLELNLYGWTLGATINNNLTKTALPLENSFVIPIFIISLKNNDSFLFVNEKELVIISVHDIMSANYGFYRIPFTGSFPTSYYRPLTRILSQTDTKTDEIMISTDNGVIYSVIVFENNIQLRPVMRISDPISVFSLEKSDDVFSLIFGCDTGSSRELYVTELFSEEYLQEIGTQKPCYSNVQLITDFKNWTPVLDVLIIDSYKSRTINSRSDQELWALTGIGRRTRLTQLRNGYNATRRSRTYEQLRKSDKLYLITLGSRFYLFCSLPFATKVLEYQPLKDEYLVEIEDAAIDNSNSSLFIGNISQSQDILIQITRYSITITNLFDLNITSKFENERILFCDMHNGFLAMIVASKDKEKSTSLRLFKVNNDVNFHKSLEDSGALDLVGSLDIAYEPSMIRLIGLDMSLYLITGSYDGSLYIYQYLGEQILEYKEYVLDEFNPYRNNDLRENFIIPHDSVQTLSPRTNLYVGSKDGYYIHFHIDTNFVLRCKHFLKIGDTPVKFQNVHNEGKMVFIHSRSLWLLNLYDSEFPTQVYFEERHDRAISAMIQLPNFGLGNSTISNVAKHFGFVREEGFTISSVHPFKSPNVKQINIAESAKKLTYLPHLSTFVILCNSKDPRLRLKFIDRKALKILQHHELNSRLKNLDFDECIFGPDEMPMAACIWSVKRQNRVSKKLLIGNANNDDTGSFKVLDITKAQDSRESPVYIRVTELTSFEHKEPITHIQQIESSILFSGGRTIYSTTYNIDERRLKPVSALVTLTSDIISLSVEGNKLLVTTKLDSIFHFIYSKNDDGDSDMLKLIYKDPSPKSIVNQTELNENIIAGDKLHSSILIMNTSDSNLRDMFSYKMSSIPRVYASKFNSYWANHETSKELKSKSNNSNILCVGINGEITSIRSPSSINDELGNLAKSLNTGKLIDGLIESFVEVLNRPFIDKVTGKGLSSINKPYFNYKDNKGKLIDYDLDEISKLCDINVSI